MTKKEQWDEYDSAALHLAKLGLTGEIGDPLPNLMTLETVQLINIDPESFQKRVRQFAYALAMEAKSDPVQELATACRASKLPLSAAVDAALTRLGQ